MLQPIDKTWMNGTGEHTCISSLGVTALEFHQDLWCKNTSPIGYRAVLFA